MKPRFSENQPWNFGYSPSKYYATLSRKQQAKLNLNKSQLDFLDDLQELANNCPNTRKLNGVEAMLDADNQISLYLTLAYCKPASVIDVRKRYAEDGLEVEDIASKFGLSTRKIIAVEGLIEYHYVGYCDEIIKLCIKNQESYSKTKDNEYNLVNGILFGYPIGDAFGSIFGDTESTTLPLLHDVAPSYWSKEWEEKVGAKAAEHLEKVYRKNLPICFLDLL